MSIVPAAPLPWWVPLAVAAAAFLAYLNTLPFEFVQDDDVQVLRNPWIRDWSHVWQMFTTDVWRFRNPDKSSNYYRPIHMLLHALGYSISGLKPHGYHLINIVLHSACSAMTCMLLYRIAPAIWPAAAAGLIFALHPAHAESVTWIAGVTDLACAFFYLAALYTYIQDSSSKPNQRRMLLVVLLFVCALFSKEMAFTFPLVAALLDWSLDRKLRWSRYAWLAGGFLFYALLRLSALGTFHVTHNPVQLSVASRLLSTMVLYGQYLIKLIVPYDLNAFHVFTPATMMPVSQVVLAVAVLAAFIAGTWFLRKGGAPLFAIGFCLISLVPALNISGVGENVFADRYLYIPTIGGSILICVLGRHFWSRVPKRLQTPGAPLAVSAAVLLIACYGYILSRTTFMWRDPITLYTETLRRSPNAVLMANSLGAEYFYRGDYEHAREWFEKAYTRWDRNFIRSNFNLFDSYSGMGGIFLHQGEPEKALEYFLKAQEIMPNEISVLQNLGVVYATIGDYLKAVSHYEQALNLNPQSEATYNNLAALYLKHGQYDQAIESARRALSIHPRFGEAHVNIARAYVGKGLIGEARRAYQAALDADPNKAQLIRSELSKLSAQFDVR